MLAARASQDDAQQTRAVKCIRLTGLALPACIANVREAVLLAQLSHPFIVHVYAAHIDPHTLVMVLEPCQAPLERSALRSDAELMAAMQQCVLGVLYLHAHRIVHRDLKRENILIARPDDSFLTVKIIDLGLSRRLDANCLAETLCGTPTHMAPDYFQGGDDFGVDLWALGLIFYRLLWQRPAVYFGNELEACALHYFQLQSSPAQGISVPTDPPISHPLAGDAVHLVQQLLFYKRQERITDEALAVHPFVSAQALQYMCSELHTSPEALIAASTVASIEANRFPLLENELTKLQVLHDSHSQVHAIVDAFIGLAAHLAESDWIASFSARQCAVHIMLQLHVYGLVSRELLLAARRELHTLKQLLARHQSDASPTHFTPSNSRPSSVPQLCMHVLRDHFVSLSLGAELRVHAGRPIGLDLLRGLVLLLGIESYSAGTGRLSAALYDLHRRCSPLLEATE
jgi:serine/threonine protein kinase